MPQDETRTLGTCVPAGLPADQDEFGGSWFDDFEDIDASGLPGRYLASEAG